MTEHSLRRTFATLMHRAGIPLATVDEVLGHSTGDGSLDYVTVQLEPWYELVSRIKLDPSATKKPPTKELGWQERLAASQARNTAKQKAKA